MRIVEFKPNIRVNNLAISKSCKDQKQINDSKSYINFDRANYCASNIYLAQMPSFKGYKEDKIFIESAINLLDTTIDNVSSILKNTYEYHFDNDFIDTVEAIKQDKDLYSKITESPEIFDKLEAGFAIFNDVTLGSVDDVRYNQKTFSNFWEKTSKIGEQKTSDIIKQALNKSGENINKIIKKTDDEDYEKIKLELKKAWFNSAYNLLKQEKPETVTKNYNELAKTVNPQYAKTFLLNEQTRLCNEFNEKTKGRILSVETNNDQKEQAFKLMLSFIQSKMLEDKAQNLDKDFAEIQKAKNTLQYAKDKESMFYAKYAIDILHNMAFEKWEKDNLNQALNIKLQKEIFYNKEEKKNEELTKFQNYKNFDTDGKYFVARYYDACCKDNDKYNFDSKDYVWQIINNRHNTKPAKQAINDLSIAVKEQQDFYFAQLDSFYDLLEQRKIDPEIQMPIRQVDTPNDKLSFADLYLEKLGKIGNFKRKSEDEKLDYLSNLTKEEMLLLNAEIKKDWYKNDQKYSLLAKVNEHARTSSVFLEMCNELKKINVNLEDIKIKTNEMTISLKDALENRNIVAKQINEDSVIKLSAQISQLQRDYDSLDPEQQKVVDEKISEVYPNIIQTLLNEKTDKNLEDDLLKLSKVAKNKESTNTILSNTKSLLISHCLRDGVNSGVHYVKHINELVKAAKVTNSLSWANLGLNTTSEGSPFNEFLDMMPPDIDPVNAVQNIGAGLSVAAGGLAAKSGVTGSIAAAMSNPITACAVITALVAGGGAIISANKASKLEHKQRDLVFKIEI